MSGFNRVFRQDFVKLWGENLLVGAQTNEGILHCCPYPKPRIDQLRIMVGFSDKMSLAKLFLGLNGFSQITCFRLNY
jgi:hypothetical protein